MAHRFRLLPLLLLTAAPLGLSSCSGFFVCQKASCSTSSTSSSANNFAYAANSASGTTYINGYALSSGTLVAATSSPYSIGYIPSAMAVAPGDGFLYVATDQALSGTGEILGYSIGTGGALTALNSGVGLVAENSSAIDITPDGKWLFSLNSDGLTLEEYSINTSTGLLTFAANYSITPGTAGAVVTPSMVKVAPSNDFIVCALGVGGVETFSFNTTTGGAAASSAINTGSTSSGIYGVTVDTNNNIYTVGTGGLGVFSSTTAGAPTQLAAYSTGNGPRSVIVSSNGSYVYVANQTDGTITAYSIGTNTVLSTVGTYPAPTTVTSLARDNSGTYLLALGYSASSGTQMFSIGSSGSLALTSSTSSGTVTTNPAPLATTH